MHLFFNENSTKYNHYFILAPMRILGRTFYSISFKTFYFIFIETKNFFISISLLNSINIDDLAPVFLQKIISHKITKNFKLSQKLKGQGWVFGKRITVAARQIIYEKNLKASNLDLRIIQLFNYQMSVDERSISRNFVQTTTSHQRATIIISNYV